MRSISFPPSSEPPTEPAPWAHRDDVRREWDAVAADWEDERWWSYIERAAQGLNDRLVELAHVGPGSRVLDVGTGTGEPAVTAARAALPGGRVVGIDLAPRMIEVARRRVRRLRLDHVRMEVADATRLADGPFRDGSFDAVLSRWMLMLLPDLPAVLRRFRALLTPGGTLSAALWGHPSEVPMISSALALLGERFGVAQPEPGEPSPFWTTGRASFEAMLAESGFADVHGEDFDITFEFATPETYAEFVGRMAGPLRFFLEQLKPERRATVLAALAEIGRRFSGEDGAVRFTNRCLVACGRRPE